MRYYRQQTFLISSVVLFYGVDTMKLLEEKILKDGSVLPGNILKVGSFLNHQIDTSLIAKMAKEVKEIYKDEKITKILTVEASGIAIAAIFGVVMELPIVFAKKHATSNISGEVYSSPVHSYTHNKDYNMVVEKKYLDEGDRVLLVDDFLAVGGALTGLIDIVKQSGASLVGCAIAIEKGFQGGGDKLRREGIRVESLAIIESMSDSSLTFRK